MNNAQEEKISSAIGLTSPKPESSGKSRSGESSSGSSMSEKALATSLMSDDIIG